MKKVHLFQFLKVTKDFGAHPHSDPLVIGTDLRIWIILITIRTGTLLLTSRLISFHVEQPGPRL
jgi:hypothetical protein